MTSEQFELWTLPEHRRCYHWQELRLPCESFERLLQRAAGRCEVCGIRGGDLRKGRLYIDHQHGCGWIRDGEHTVRGMVCPRCNSHLRLVDAGRRRATPEQERYLRNSWYLYEFGYEHPQCFVPAEFWYLERYGARVLELREQRAASRQRRRHEKRGTSTYWAAS